MRLSPMFTVQAGARWEYETPPTEALGRLVNLDVAPGFTAVSPVQPGADRRAHRPAIPELAACVRTALGIQPRIGIAWRPVPGSSLVVRAGYGVYRNTAVYQPITTLLAQQPPLSKTFTASNSAANPLTLANGFTPPPVTPSAPGNTFAVDPDLQRRRVAELAGARAARSAGVAHGDRDVPRARGASTSCRSSCPTPIRLAPSIRVRRARQGLCI